MKTLLSSFFDAFRVLDNDSFSVNQSLHLRNETKKFIYWKIWESSGIEILKTFQHLINILISATKTTCVNCFTCTKVNCFSLDLPYNTE